MEDDKPQVSIELVEFSGVTDSRKRTMLECLKKNLGIVASASKAANINRDTHYDWLKKDAVYAQAVESIQESAIDFAESKLFELMQGVTVQVPGRNGPVIYTTPPNVAACIFYLKTKAKKRGYVERIQLGDFGDDEMETTLSL